jgi:superfamily II DNA/RNA helicase
VSDVPDTFLHTPVRVEVSKPASTAATVTQILVATGREPHDKRETLRQLIRTSESFKNAIIFCNRKREVALLHRSLVKHGFNAVALHGDLDQSERTAALDRFRRDDAKLLVASDVAARGLDIPAVSHVFNFDVPHHADDYVHRIGRTGRAGLTGTAITLVAPIDKKAVAAIEHLTGQAIAWQGAPQQETAEPHEQRSRGRSGRGKPDGQRRNERGPRQPERRPEHKPDHSPAPQRKSEPSHVPVARIDEARKRRRPEPVAEIADADNHLPAFLLRPVRVKA